MYRYRYRYCLDRSLGRQNALNTLVFDNIDQPLHTLIQPKAGKGRAFEDGPLPGLYAGQAEVLRHLRFISLVSQSQSP